MLLTECLKVIPNMPREAAVYIQGLEEFDSYLVAYGYANMGMLTNNVKLVAWSCRYLEIDIKHRVQPAIQAFRMQYQYRQRILWLLSYPKDSHEVDMRDLRKASLAMVTDTRFITA